MRTRSSLRRRSPRVMTARRERMVSMGEEFLGGL
jgi:hypothetical protein